MGQFILFLLGLFAIGCVLYGISAGVQIIQRSFSWLTNIGGSNDTPPITETDNAKEQSLDTSPLRRGIRELRELFVLHQEGVLTHEEFEHMKRHILSAVQSTPDIH